MVLLLVNENVCQDGSIVIPQPIFCSINILDTLIYDLDIYRDEIFSAKIAIMYFCTMIARYSSNPKWHDLTQELISPFGPAFFAFSLPGSENPDDAWAPLEGISCFKLFG